MKVFISHQSADTAVAHRVSEHLRVWHGIASYLDVIDPYMNGRGEDLAAHIRSEMGKCTQLLAVISYNTLASQWVPWEIGVATEKDFPLATYSNATTLPPEFLRRWPYLRSDADLDRYAAASKSARSSYVQKSVFVNDSEARSRSTRDFYSSLRGSLGQ